MNGKTRQMIQSPENEGTMKKKRLDKDAISEAIKRTTQEKAEEALELSTAIDRAMVSEQQDRNIKAKKNNISQEISGNGESR